MLHAESYIAVRFMATSILEAKLSRKVDQESENFR
jgi:hypothetical protein